MTHLSRSDFPDSFLFGAATSAYQIEGHGFGGAGETHWDTFAATPGNVVRQENGNRACDHYHRYAEDLKLAGDLGLDIYRFSTSWARLVPDGRGAPNPDGLAFYDRLIDTMLENGLKPAATLYHWELPSPLADLGGWRNREIANWFGDFAALVAQHFGDRLWSVAPINEPWCVGWLSHFEGHHAPGLRDIRATARAVHHVLLAHGHAISAMRAAGLANLGAVCNFEHALPATSHTQDILAAERQNAIYNHFFLSGLFKGTYPDLVLEGLEPFLPVDWECDFTTIGAPIDWIGVNYYTCSRVLWTGGAWPNVSFASGHLPKTTMGWEIRPQSLGDILEMVATDYAPGLPIYVTENGMSADDRKTGDTVADPQRVNFLRDHMGEVARALKAGLDIRGFIVWSLLDNYEWALGYEKRFGLIHVDFETLARTPKTSYHRLQGFLAGGHL
ncbi:MAG: GH1 family beta-glucosidase [Pseudomonadota bacterium]